MFDTVCLLIPKGKMRFLTGVSSWELYSKTDQYTKFVRNPSKAEKDTGKYFPRLTGYRRGFRTDENVKIEFSAPKLLFLNNLDELEDKDFPRVVETLQERLKEMGVLLTKSDIEKASVSSIHFSKNILLEDGYTANYIISELGKVDLRKSFDFAKTRFINDGQSLYAHTNSHQFVVYDKIADLGKEKKRAIDKDQTIYQKNLFSNLTKNNEPKEIVRIEIRLNHKQKLNKIMEELGYKKNLNFEEISKSHISKSVVNNYWNKLIIEKNSGLFSVQPSIKSILQIMFLTDRKLKPNKAVLLLGLYVLARDENGIRQLRSIVSQRMHERTWYRMAKDLRYANELITKNNLREWVKQIQNKLDKYEAYKTSRLSTIES